MDGIRTDGLDGSGRPGIKAGLIVLDHNDAQDALRLCRSLAPCEALQRIVVVENGGEGACEALRPLEQESEKIEVLSSKNEGYAKGNNLGVRRLMQRFGEFDYYVIANPDVAVTQEALLACVGFLEENKSYALAAPHMLRPDGTQHPLSGWRERSFQCDLAYSSGLLSRLVGMYREVYPPAHWQTPVSDVDCAAGSFFVIRGVLFRQVGLFDEKTFLYYEEDILGSRLRHFGWKLAVLNTVTFVHNEGAAVGKALSELKKYRAMQKSRLYFQRRYKQISEWKYTLLRFATAMGTLEKLIKLCLPKRRET